MSSAFQSLEWKEGAGFGFGRLQNDAKGNNARGCQTGQSVSDILTLNCPVQNILYLKLQHITQYLVLQGCA